MATEPENLESFAVSIREMANELLNTQIAPNEVVDDSVEHAAGIETGYRLIAYRLIADLLRFGLWDLAERSVRSNPTDPG